MRSLTFVAPGEVEWREAPAPNIGHASQAIIRPLVIGRCDLDVGFVHGLMPIASGEPLGHELIGEIVDIGDGVNNFEPGDLAVLSAQICCGYCDACKRGHTGRCQSVPFAASYGMGREGNFGGTAADLVLVPFADAMLFPLPSGAKPVDWIGFADMAQDAYRAVGPQLQARPNGRVLVIGGLPQVIGIYAAGLAVALGASEVDYFDDNEARLAEARDYGANALNRNTTEPDGLYDIVVDSSIAPQALIDAFRYAAPEAYVTSVSVHPGELAEAPFMLAYNKGVHYRTGRPNCRQHMQTLADLCCSQKFQPEKISTTIFSFDDAPKAWLSKALRTIAVV